MSAGHSAAAYGQEHRYRAPRGSCANESFRSRGLQAMASTNTGRSAFDQGQAAGRDVTGSPPANPFGQGSAEHNNFEVGRRFGAANAEKHLRPSAEAMTPDADEEEN